MSAELLEAHVELDARHESPANATTYQEALERLQDCDDNDSPLWDCQTVTIENQHIQSNEVDIINADTYKVFAKLTPEKWATLFELFQGEGAVDESYKWQQKLGGPDGAFIGQQTKTKSRRLHTDWCDVFLIYADNALSYDGLLEIRVPKTSAENDARTIETAIHQMTASRYAATAEQAMRDYYNLPIGPLSKQDLEREELVSRRQTSPHHMSPVIDGLHEQYHSDSSGEQLIARHEVTRLEDTIDIITSGAAVSMLERLKRGGGGIAGRSSAADVLYGGADAVFAYMGTANKPAYQAAFQTKPEIFDRLDVRVYDTDAYGSRERTIPSSIDTLLDRKSGGSYVTYDDRVRPADYGSVRGVHEVCFEKEIGIGECDLLLMPEGSDKSSFHDFRWSNILPDYPVESWHMNTYGQSKKGKVISIIEQVWGDPEEVKATLGRLAPDMSEEQIDYLVTGMNASPRDRIIARLHKKGVTMVNGRPVEEFVVTGE